MGDGRNLPALDVGEELRRIIAGRRRRRRRLGLAALIGGSVVLTAVSFVWTPPTLLVWNASASAPTGLYRILAAEPVRHGDMVVAWTPGPARTLAARRRYLPANVPLVKRVAAVAGDEVCAIGGTLLISGRRVAIRQRLDASGRAMPWWHGCRRLRPSEYFLLMDSPASFDGRYFGVTKKGDLVGRAVLL